MEEYLPRIGRIIGMFLGCATLTASAQIPNGGFESWTDHGNYQEPTGWLTYNEVPTAGGPTVEAGTPGHSGSFHAVITTRQPATGTFPIQGWISAGSTPDRAGFPYAGRPAALTGQWQYSIQPGDQAQVMVGFTKWNGTATEPMGIGTLEVSGAINAWQPFTVPINWVGDENPDTAYIQIVSSIDFMAPVPGSTVKVDDLAFSGSAGVTESTNTSQVFVQITNTGDRLNVVASGAGTLRFFDTGGRLLADFPVPQPHTVIDAANLPKGLLLYRFITTGAEATATGKLVRE